MHFRWGWWPIRGRARIAAICLAICGGLASAPSGAAPVASYIVNGAQELAEPTTGALIRGDLATGHVICTVTLVGCDVALTTAHCFNASPGELDYVYFQHAGFYEIESATRHPAYVAGLPPTFDPDALRVEDIAFIKLTEPVTGITPTTLMPTDPDLDGTPAWIVGFGRDPITSATAAIADYNAGIKRSGTMEIKTCAGTLAGEDVLCWDPPDPQGSTGTDVTTCNGDSGGPLFLQGYTPILAGLTKGHVIDNQGQSDLCIPPVDPYDTKIFRHRGWIDGGTGTGGMVATTSAMSLATKQCSALPQFAEDVQSGDLFGACEVTAWAPDETVRTCGFTGFLDAVTPSLTHSFEVVSGTQLLRVAFNGIAEGNGTLDTDFYLRAGSPPTTSVYDCAADGTGTLGYCEFQDPTVGTWHVLVDQTLYQGEYQVTVSTFAEGPPGPVPVPAVGVAGRFVLFGLLGGATLSLGLRRSRGGGRPSAR